MSAIVKSLASLGDGAGLAVARHLEGALRCFLSGENATNEPRFLRFMLGEPHPLANFAFIADPNSVEDTRAGVLPLLTCRQPSGVLFTAMPSEDVDAQLSEYGYVRESMPVLAIDIDDLAATTLPDGYAFSRIEDIAGSQAWTAVAADASPIPPRLAEAFSPEAVGLEATGPTQCFAIWKDGRAVATSMLHLQSGLAGIYCVSTLAAERGLGLGGHVTAEALRVAANLGYRVGVLQSTADGLRIYRRLGFQELGTMPLYLRTGL